MARKRTNHAWNSCTWNGARHEQLRRWGKLTLREKLQAVEDMGEIAAHFAKRHRQRKIAARAT